MMKSVSMSLILTAVLVCASGCGNQQVQDALSRLEAAQALLEENKALVLRAHEEVWNSGDLVVLEELYSPDYVAHWADGEDSDRDGLKQMVTEARTAFPDLTEDVVHIVAEGDLVVTYFISSGTFTGEMNGLVPSGKSVSRPEIAIHRIADGMIVEQWTVSDQLTLMRQLGLM